MICFEALSNVHRLHLARMRCSCSTLDAPPRFRCHQGHRGRPALRLATPVTSAVAEVAEAASAAPAGPPFKTQKGTVDHVAWVLHELAQGDKVVVVQTAPAVRVALGEEFGLDAGTSTTGQMVAALRMLGFHYVFDTNAGADITIMEEGHELMERLYTHLHPSEHPAPLPMFTSCCPAWVETLERRYPELIPHLSSTKSPVACAGSAIKNFFPKKIGRSAADIVSVTIMPCLKKQQEADRIMNHTPEGHREIDHVITTRELAALIKERGWDYPTLEPSEFDDFLGLGTGAGQIFGSTGGVMEAVLRTVHDLASGEQLPRLEMSEVRGLDGVKEATVTIKPNPGGPLKNQEPVEVRVAVANGLGNAKKILEEVQQGRKSFHFVEVMACPGGCIGGGGQPRSKDKDILKKRQAGIYSIDERLTVRRSYESPVVQALYQEWAGGHPGSPEAHAMLHTFFEACGPETFDITAPPPPLQAPACELPNLEEKVCLVYGEPEEDYLGRASDNEGESSSKPKAEAE